MAKWDNLLERAFSTIKQESLPTQEQKDIMLDQILNECKSEKTSALIKMKKIVIAYPWRFAFTVSTVQSVVFTIIFGTRYTNLFLNFFGG